MTNGPPKEKKEDELVGFYTTTGKESPISLYKPYKQPWSEIIKPMDFDGEARLFSQGDQGSFRTLFEKAVPIIQADAVRRLGDPTDGDDVASLVMIAMWCRREEFSGTYEDFVKWGRGLVEGQVRNWRRGSKRRLQHEAPDGGEAEVSVEPTVESRAFQDHERMALVRKHMGMLRPGLRLVVERTLNHWTLEEIAEASSLSKTRISQLYDSAVEELQKLIRGDRDIPRGCAPAPAGRWWWIPWVLVGLPDDEDSLARKQIREEEFRRDRWR